MKSRARRLRVPLSFGGSGLRRHMTVSYVAVTLGSVLTFMLLITLPTGVLAALFTDPGQNSAFLGNAQKQAQSYALVAGLRSQGMTLEPRTSFIPGQAEAIALPGQEDQFFNVFAPYITTASPDPISVTIALLIAP
ncbi:MAG TPA: hypothetical protein VJO32_03210, partial [Ktedonobacteraceae bacterium]|nr:hypothetical protein [Ktedonobacteraceae bacterium]